MKRLLFLLPFFISLCSFNWTSDQLLKPADLADMLNNPGKEKPLVLNMGSMQNIKTALYIGPASSAEGLTTLKEKVKDVSRNKLVVVYCGCCTLVNCPNIKPAYDTLKAMGFARIKVLDLPTGLNEDWKSKGFPME